MTKNRGNSKGNILIQKRLKRSKQRRNWVIRLTSLIDVFTILLVFLLKNFSTMPEGSLLSQNLNLPVSTSHKYPEISTTIAATQSAVLINGKFVDSIEHISNQKELISHSLYEKLIEEKEKTLFVLKQMPGQKFQGKITIQADKRIPYKVIKRLIYTCGQAEFGEVSLHVFKEEI